MMEEIELSERCKNGDNAARKELYEKYAPLLYGTCLRYLGDRSVAEDILHDSFIKIFQSFDCFSWRGEGSLRAWMSKIVVNAALRQIKKREALHQYEEDMEHVSQEYDAPTPEQVDRVPQKVLMGYIAELPQGYRTVFNLYVLENKSHKEIADMLHINEKSSSSQLYRAKAILAKKIKEWMKRNE